jgi:hypothetical protein
MTEKPVIQIRVRHALAAWALRQSRIVNKYNTNQIVRLLDIWCRLKAYAGDSGLIKQRLSKMQEIAAFCECSMNKLRPALNELKRMGWLHMDGFCIQLKSEKKIYELCGLEYHRKIDRIFYKPEKIKDETHTHYWLYLADIADNKERQAYCFTQKLKLNPELKLWWYGVLQQQKISIQQAEKDNLLLAGAMLHLYRNNFHSKESEMFGWLVENRPDVNRGVLGMADAWNTAPMNVVYVKKKMQEQLIAFVQKIGTIGSSHWSHNKHCRVMWNKHKKQTFQAFCDDIVPRSSTVGSEIFKIRTAA